MEHYKSTLGTTAIAAFGLLAAAHILHPGNYDRADRNVRVVVVTNEMAAAPMIWTDPPFKLYSSEPAALMEGSGALLAYSPTISLPLGTRMAPRLAGSLVDASSSRGAQRNRAEW